MSDFLELFLEYLPDMLRGARVTLLLTAQGLGAGFVLGLLAAYWRVYGSKFWRAIAVGYIELFRGTPLLVQLFLIYYGLPGLGITLSPGLAAFLALGLNSGAYQAEYLRGSILAIGEGQMMAGRAIGMSRRQVIWHIILPQALRLAIPAWSNEPVSLLKSTAIVFLIAIPDLMAKAKFMVGETYNSIGSYFAVAIVYLAIVYLVDIVLRWLERAARIPGFEMEGRKA